MSNPTIHVRPLNSTTYRVTCGCGYVNTLTNTMTMAVVRRSAWLAANHHNDTHHGGTYDVSLTYPGKT